jgi:SAM-dependent methyltransferase
MCAAAADETREENSIMSKPQAETATSPTPAAHHRACPWWLGPLMASRVRRLFDNPDALLTPFIKPGMTVLDFGCAMGFHTLPAARLVGERGRVIAVDIEPRMLAGLRRRAVKAGLLERIDARLCSTDGSGLDGLAGAIDVALAVHVIHETPDIAHTFTQLHSAIRPGGKLLIAEPKGHVSSASLRATLAHAEAAGFRIVPTPVARWGWTRVLERSPE